MRIPTLLATPLFFAATAFAAPSPQPITVDYPANNSLFPPDIASPTFLWRDPNRAATFWRIEVKFTGRTKPIQVESKGEPMPIGEIDLNCKKAGAVDPVPTPEQAQQHSWQPDDFQWSAIKRASVEQPASITFTGFSGPQSKEPVSRGTVAIRTSTEPVGAPIFFRDVPLISVPVGEKGVIMPLPAGAVPLIAWRLRHVGEKKSKLMMEGLPTCANCHSFSKDGATLGLDVDGPQNDKGLYGLVPVARNTSIRNKDVIRWSSFNETPALKRFGFMSQVSPDGQFVVTCIETPGSTARGMDGRFFNGFYKDYGFGQVFFPTRGVLAWYSKKTGKLEVLPGADDPEFVHAGAFWSPDGKYLIYSRARAKDPYYEGQKMAEYANDPAETQIQYDLYRIPFNDGRGGTPELLVAGNGKSLSFPKVSPDGKWVVYVQAQNGLLMRPDSELYIVPLMGGTPRRLDCNTPRMNSWHSFSPVSRWMVFSSKGRSLFTQMYLTRIDENGDASPAILIENATAANRGVNIPEFANLKPGDFETLDAPATDFYRVVDLAMNFAKDGKDLDALNEWNKAIGLDPEDAKARFNYALSLDRLGRTSDATAEYRRALDLNPEMDSAYTNLGATLAASGNLDEAEALFSKALSLNQSNSKAHANLAAVQLQAGKLDDAILHSQEAISLDPEYADAFNTLGWALARKNSLPEAEKSLEKAVALTPESFEYRYNFGRVLAAQRKFQPAIPQFEKAVIISKGQEPYSVDMLAAMYSEVGRIDDAVLFAQRAVVLATQARNEPLRQEFETKLARYKSLARQR